MMNITDDVDQGDYELEQFCPLCGDTYKIRLSVEEMAQYDDYRNYGGYIQEAMPSLNKVEREFLLTGYCPDCQVAIFGNGKTNRIKLSERFSVA
ncbi:hypothetical protein IKF28_03175 [Candidatus Saccharibacteria bacterium]|nr:hypothetical protein [Candidatus Saccharibacteria bacterium]